MKSTIRSPNLADLAMWPPLGDKRLDKAATVAKTATEAGRP